MHYKEKLDFFPRIACRIFICFSLMLPSCSRKMADQPDPVPDYQSYQQQIYVMLDTVVKSRQEKLVSYLDEIRKNAEAIQQDPLMMSFFKAKKDYYEISKEMAIPVTIESQILELKKSVQEHYVHKYMNFYDILFINPDGDVFYTIKQEDDYHKNIFHEETLSGTALAKRMQSMSAKSFVDFQFYQISGEPSAFFVVPVADGNEITGWIALQFVITKINSLFANDSKIGATGEVFLVNKDHFMLTDSRFKAHSTILRQKLSDENINSKFQERKGHKVVIDYRNNRALSSFEVFQFLESEWLIIAKLNEDEVLTRYFKSFTDTLLNKIGASVPPATTEISNGTLVEKHARQADIDEVVRSVDGPLKTIGVSECTAILIHFPGRFSYLAHISPYDAIYGQNKTDILGQLLRKINYLEIKKIEKSQLQITVIAPHKHAWRNVVKKLVGEGIFLSQIQLVHKTNAWFANILHSPEKGETWVEWHMPDNSRRHTIITPETFPNLGFLLHQNFSGKS